MRVQTPEQRQYIAALRELDRQLGRQRRNRLLVRAVWIAILVACIGLIIQNWLTWPIQTPLIGLIALVALAIGVTYALLPGPGSRVMARGFDRVFALDEELATALELSDEARRDGLSALVVERAQGRLEQVQREVALRAGEPMRVELQTLAMTFVLAAGLLVLGSLSTVLPTVPAAALPEPGRPPAADPPEIVGPEPTPEPTPEGQSGEQPVGNEQGSEPQLSPEDQEAASEIADALRDNGATRAAADALDNGDTQQAAQELRDLAEQAGDLSRASRDDLAEQLEQAADNLEESQPELADRLRQSAERLRSNSDQAAAQGLEDLAEAIEDLGNADQPAGQQPQSPGAGDQQGQQSGEGQQGQQGSEGQQPGSGSGEGPGNQTGSRQVPPPAAPNNPIPLPEPPTTDGETTQADGNNSETVITKPPSTTDAGTNGGGGTGGSVPSDLSDPAAIPPELRDAVQDYFNGQSR